jgi:hypothetical protein
MVRGPVVEEGREQEAALVTAVIADRHSSRAEAVETGALIEIHDVEERRRKATDLTRD